MNSILKEEKDSQEGLLGLSRKIDINIETDNKNLNEINQKLE